MNWSAEQHRMLGAMGFEMLVRASQGEPEAALAAPAVTGPPANERAGATASADEYEALRRAVQRAAGGHDLAGLVDDLARLRREPGQKRALWLRLRTLLRNS